MIEDSDQSPVTAKFDRVVEQLTARLEQSQQQRPKIVGQIESPLNVTAQRYERKNGQIELALKVAEIMAKIARGESLDPEEDSLEVGLVKGLDREKIVFKLD